MPPLCGFYSSQGTFHLFSTCWSLQPRSRDSRIPHTFMNLKVENSYIDGANLYLDSFHEWKVSSKSKILFPFKNLKSICKSPSVNKRINYQPFAKILLPQLTSDHHFSTHPALISSCFNGGGAVELLQTQF